ncbi:iron ABC transporter permease [Bacillus sp. CBEL-1]|uniref:FecCD family ABC transporter permease n=1 Tax=Bacillus sp. CBEL-1 TaxID=2502980 RepID=UPI00104FF569|nr:iron ABC transporter permease [Bacillus sp. CBEL-1]TDB50143.1 iron ABC transporter permease [Bacillus sp. CBEL-1]
MTTNKKPFIPFIFKLIIGFLIFIGMFIISMVFGAADISVKDVWLALISTSTNDQILIIRELRLPREVAAIFVGIALSVSGGIMQGMTRNPLADPGLLGLTAGAKAALALTIALIPSANYFWIMIACFIGAGVGAGLVFGIGSLKRGGFSPLRIVLAGAAVSTFLYAIADGIGIYFNISKDVSMWTSGGLTLTSWNQLSIIIPFIIVGTLIALALSRQLTILSLSDEVATGLGQHTTKIKVILFGVIVLLAGASVALAGNLVFIGLMIPHIVRAIVGTDYRFIIPMSVLIGSSFMLFADTLARTINAPYETSIIAVVSMIGLPFFLFIIKKGGHAIR